LKITFLGTGTSQGVPVIGCTCEVCRSLDFRDKRFRSSVHVQVDNQSLVIDTGPDFRQQMLRENINRLDAILFTHAHRDHTAGLDDVRAYNFMQNMDMPAYALESVLKQLRSDYSYVFIKDQYPGLPRLTLFEVNTAPFSINGTNIIPLPVKHLHLPVLGFRINNFSYITDANYISDETVDLLKGTEILVLNALQQEKHVSHFNLEEALAEVKRIKPAKAYFTHISHKLGLHAEVQRKLPDNVFLGFDGLQLQV
jgi:phosphoribosyl 1,2-cyclic phosphate phosphodiesterase